jgi:hypothetical protein
LDRDENAAKNILKERIGYGRAYRNLWSWTKQLFGRISLYCCWRNPASANWLVDQRIPTPSGPGVSNQVVRSDRLKEEKCASF